MTIFDGVIPPLVTPFNDDYSINEEVLRDLVDRLVDEGINAVITTGSSGEFTRLSTEERKRVLEVVVDQAGGRIPVIAGTAASGTLEAIELSRHAESAGAAGLQIVPPFYAVLSDDEVYDHYSRIGQAVGIPILMYNNRVLTSVDMSPALIARLAEIPNVDGIKEATGDSRRMRQIITLAGDSITVFAGVDDNVLEAYALGVRGWVAGVANLLPRQCVELHATAVERGDLATARRLYFRMSDLCDKIESDVHVQTLKYGLELLGVKAGPTRPPLLPLSDEDRRQVRSLLDQVVTVPA